MADERSREIYAKGGPVEWPGRKEREQMSVDTCHVLGTSIELCFMQKNTSQKSLSACCVLLRSLCLALPEPKVGVLE